MGVGRDLFSDKQKDSFTGYKYSVPDVSASLRPNTKATLPPVCIVCVCSAPPDIGVVLLRIRRIHIVTFLSQWATHKLHPSELIDSAGQQHAVVMQVGALLTARLQVWGENSEW